MAVLVRVITESRSDASVARVRSSPSLSFSLSGASSSTPFATAVEEEEEEEKEEGRVVVVVVVVVVSPCPRASSDRMPADGRRFLISDESTAKERPEEPAPWWVTKSGPGALPGPAEGAGEVK
jgi:hypothetical protein